MTILQFQQLYYISQAKIQSLDKSIQMVGVITGKTPEQVDTMSMRRFNRICRKINKHFEVLGSRYNNGKPKKYVFLKGRMYQLHYNIKRKPMNAGRYVEAIAFGKDVVNNLHKIMATMSTPMRWSWKKFKFVPYEREHEDIATDFESMDFETAYHAAVFFYTVFRVSMQIIQPYLIQEMTSKGANRTEAEETLNTSLSILDGLTMPKWSLTLREYALNRFGV